MSVPREPDRVIGPTALTRSDAPLAPATGKTVVISLPDGVSAYDFDRFGVWCDLAEVDFGSVAIPHELRVPPSARQLALAIGQHQVPHKHPQGTAGRNVSGLNCEVLHEPLGLEFRWVLDNDEAIMQIVGRVRGGEYMSFGLSKDDAKSNMVDADAVVAWIDGAGQGHAVDYFLASKEQVSAILTVCKDEPEPLAVRWNTRKLPRHQARPRRTFQRDPHGRGHRKWVPHGHLQEGSGCS